jgi:hypothetical protein
VCHAFERTLDLRDLGALVLVEPFQQLGERLLLAFFYYLWLTVLVQPMQIVLLLRDLR